MVAPIRSGVLVPESNHVTQLVHDDTKLITVFPYRYGLRAVSPPSHEGTAPVKEQIYYTEPIRIVHYIANSVYHKQYVSPQNDAPWWNQGKSILQNIFSLIPLMNHVFASFETDQNHCSFWLLACGDGFSFIFTFDVHFMCFKLSPSRIST